MAAAILLTATAARAQSADEGKRVFQQKCSLCHDAAQGKNRLGPSLFAVVGSKAGGVAGYTYSDAVKSSGLSWDAATLDRWLKSPKGVVPGTKMTYAGLSDDKQRADLIAYLATLH
jgi:cytochrome c